MHDAALTGPRLRRGGALVAADLAVVVRVVFREGRRQQRLRLGLRHLAVLVLVRAVEPQVGEPLGVDRIGTALARPSSADPCLHLGARQDAVLVGVRRGELGLELGGGRRAGFLRERRSREAGERENGEASDGARCVSNDLRARLARLGLYAP